MNHGILRGNVFKGTILATAALVATRLFFVQQLIAVFLVFSVVFACAAVVVLMLFGLDLAWRAALGRAEAYIVVLSRSMHDGRAHVHNPAVASILTPVLAHRLGSHK
ncbi:MAG TPA: hypothetical protein VE263_14605 [Candidatus Angelobacter sp.]|nr:hypothetical protein [Candidatus Angelobacter sp.]